MAQTPASSRRFLPTQSSSTKSTAPSTVRRNPFKSSRPTQLPPPSSSFNATPRFQQSTPKIAADGIQSSFDDETDTPLPKGRFSTRTRTTGDPLDEVDESLSPLHSRAIEVEEDDYLHVEDQSSPLKLRQGPSSYASKRRKTTHPHADATKPIDGLSPQEDDQFEVFNRLSDGKSASSHSDLDDDIGLTGRPTTSEESHRKVRFRPSLSEFVQPSPLSKTIFKTNRTDVSAGATTNGVALPDIFSPSRRKGKRDYLPGSGADLVRSWILAIPAQESHSQALSEETLSVVDVQNDKSGRFAIITDENGSQWLLPEQQEKPGAGARYFLSTLRPGAQIRVKGRATRWELDIESHESDTVTVAAYWEVVSPR